MAKQAKDADAPPVRDLLVMPDSGRQAVADLIDGASASITLKIYTLTDPDLIERLLAAQGRGVAVRIIVNEARRDGTRDNDAAVERLKAAGIDIGFGACRFAAIHEKSLIVDHRAALVSSFNYAPKYFEATRDYGIVTRDPAEIAEIAACFDADRAGRPFASAPDSRLLWGPGTARRQVSALIASAKTGIHLQHAKLVDATILLALTRAVKRGVSVCWLSAGGHGLHDWDRPETFASLAILEDAGAKLRRLKEPRMHGNLMIVDDRVAQLGSLHFHRTSFDERRELSIEVDDAAVVAALATRFKADWKDAHAYSPPDPIAHGDTDAVDGDVFAL